MSDTTSRQNTLLGELQLLSAEALTVIIHAIKNLYLRGPAH